MAVQHNDNLFRREKVKQRLLKTAAELWDYQETDMEGFDPVVDLLFGACATEFERTDREIQQAGTRLLKRLAHLLLPEVLVTPTPAHAILHTLPVEPVHEVSLTEQFFAVKEEVNPQQPGNPLKKEIFFSPAGSFPLIHGDIKWIARGKSIHRIKNVMHQEEAIRGTQGNTLDAHTLWLGLELHPNIKILKNLSFYFNWKHQPGQENYLKLLPLTQWFFDGSPLSVSSGYPENVKPQVNLDNLLDTAKMVEQHVRQTYQSSFVTINNTIEVNKELPPFPEAILSIFSQENLAQLKGPLLWLEIRFPQLMPAEAVAHTLCAINCIPVLNRKLESSNRPYRVSKKFNMIPLRTDDYFLSTYRVDADSGKTYHAVPFGQYGDSEPYTFTIRQEGIGRFDHRHASELLSHLLEIIRDEKAAFESLGGNRLLQELKNMQQNLSRLENIIDTKKVNQDVTHYLLLNVTNDEDIWASFWSTTGSLANKIPAGTKLQSLNSTDLQKNHAMLITSSTGGRQKPNDIEQVYNYRSTLLSRERLVTKEDIKAACFSRLGKNLQNVILKKGVVVGMSPKESLKKIMEVHLIPAKDHHLDEEDWHLMCQELQTYLEQHAMIFSDISVQLSPNPY